MPRGLSLELERTFPGTPERVFEHFAGQRLARWWGPAGFSVREIDFEPRLGGAYRIQMRVSS